MNRRKKAPMKKTGSNKPPQDPSAVSALVNCRFVNGSSATSDSQNKFSEIAAKLQALAKDAVETLHAGLLDRSDSTRIRSASTVLRLWCEFEQISARVGLSSIECSPCPECANPNRKIPLEFIDEITTKYAKDIEKFQAYLRSSEASETDGDGESEEAQDRLKSRK